METSAAVMKEVGGISFFKEKKAIIGYLNNYERQQITRVLDGLKAWVVEDAAK
jgi:hypothetical protein